MQQKKDWVSKYYGDQWHVDVVPKKDKQNFAHDRGILIDDTKLNIDQWQAAGGIGIFHIGSDFQTTIKTLQSFL